MTDRAGPRSEGRTVFHTLDLLRGVAAVAVGLFYLLSGVVVSKASPLAFWLVGLAVVTAALPLDRYLDAPVRCYLSHRLGLSKRSVDAAKPL